MMRLLLAAASISAQMIVSATVIVPATIHGAPHGGVMVRSADPYRVTTTRTRIGNSIVVMTTIEF